MKPLTEGQMKVLRELGDAGSCGVKGYGHALFYAARSLIERGYAENLFPKPYTWFITQKGRELLEDIESGVYDVAILSDRQRSMILAIEQSGTMAVGGRGQADQLSVARSLCARDLARKVDGMVCLTQKGKAIAKTLRSRAWSHHLFYLARPRAEVR